MARKWESNEPQREREDEIRIIDPDPTPEYLAAVPKHAHAIALPQREERILEDDATPRLEGTVAPPPRAVPREDLAYLLSVAEVARRHAAHVEQMQAALARAMQEATKARGASEGEYARLRLRYGVGEGEDFDPETGAIFNVAERQAAQSRRDG